MAFELSVWSSYFVELSPEDALARLKKNGYNAVELSDEHGLMLLERDVDVVKTGKAFKAYADRLGMQISQGHLWLKCRIVSTPNAVEILKQWIDLYEAIGIENMVLHADPLDPNTMSPEEILERNVPKLREIADYIAGRKISICLENLRFLPFGHIDWLLALLDRIGSGQFGITLDTGHLNISHTTSQREFILKAGSRLRALHIADNEGETDQHMMPFGRGTVDFFEVVKSLKEIGYEGIFNYEIPGERHCPSEVQDLKLKYILQTYDYLMGAVK